MNKFLIVCLLCLTAATTGLAQKGRPVRRDGMISIKSPDGNLTLKAGLDIRKQLQYELSFKGSQVIKSSTLGFQYAGYINTGNMRGNKVRFGDKLTLTSVDSSLVTGSWKPVLGEVAEIQNNYRELVLHVTDSLGAQVAIVFRVFDDGLGFRYDVKTTGVPGTRIILLEEATEFTLTGDHTAWWIPGDYDTNEYAPRTTKLSEINAASGRTADEIFAKSPFDSLAVQTPLMLRSEDKALYINIHEAALVDYPAMQLELNKRGKRLMSHLTKDAVGNAAYLSVPFKSPWRTIVVSDRAEGILASKLILNLNEPCKIADPSWIKPTKYVGIWWEMHVGKSTWDYLGTQDGTYDGNARPHGKHGATTENTKRYIDFAAKHGFDGVLVEGWNVGWEDWFGKWKEGVFDFVTPYPDFDVAELQRYAAAKGVKIIMHHETSSSVTNYERQMDTAYTFMHRYGYDAVKTGYVGRIIPRGEHHDGQWMINHFNHVAERTAHEHIMVDMHESVRPTGMSRTWPNWVASEAARGQEFNAWSVGNAPEHETILPFTRIMGGAMDYTPGIFQIKLDVYGNPNKKEAVHTTLAKQLALYVTLYSPLQMAADLPENYEKHLDAFQFIEDVAADWDDTRYLDAEPGDYLVVARKAKGTQDWFLGAITDEQKRNFDIKLDFLDANATYEVTIYADDVNAHWDTNPMAYKISKRTVKAADTLSLNLAEGGGCAVSFKKK